MKSKENVINTIEILNSIDGIKYAGTNATEEYEIIPNDALSFNSDLEKGQWALDKISAPDAWKYTTGSNDVRVGIMDTGIAYHEDLNDRVVASYDFYSTTSDNPIINRIDDDSHGTHVAGIVGGEGNNSIGISGVNWDVSLIQMRVGKTGFNRDAVVRALNWAKNQWFVGLLVNSEITKLGFTLSNNKLFALFWMITSIGNFFAFVFDLLDGKDDGYFNIYLRG